MDSPLLPSTSKLQDNLFDVSADQLQFGDLSFEDTPQQPRRTYQHQDLSFEESGRHHRPEYADDASLGGGDASYIEQETPPRQQKPGPSKPRFSLFAAPASPLRDEDDDEDEDEPERQETRPSMSSSTSRQDDISSPTGSSQDDASDRSRARPLSLSQLGSADSPPHMMRLQQHPPQQSSEERDASLRRALFELQRINAVFEQYAEGLEEVNIYHSRIQAQTATTDALLESYISILSATDATSQLIFDPTWHGADSDAAEHMRQQAALIAAQQAALRAQIEREEAEALERERAEEAARKALAASSASTAMGSSSRGRGIARSRGVSSGMGASGIGKGRGVATGSVRGGGSVPSTTARGRTISYSSVRSSGYGPPARKAA